LITFSKRLTFDCKLIAPLFGGGMIQKHIAGRFRPGGIGRHMSWLLLQSVTEAGTLTVAALLAANWFGPSLWGQLGILLVGVQLISMLGDGFYPTILKYVADARAADNPAAAYIGWRFTAITVAILAGASVVLGIAAFGFFSSQLASLWVGLAVVLAAARGFRTSADGAFRGLQDFKPSALAGMTTATLMAVAIIAFSWAGYRVSWYLGIMVAGTLGNCVWLAVVYRKKLVGYVTDIGRQAVPSTSHFVTYAFPLAMRGLATFLFLKINIWMLGAMASDSDAGQFRLTDQFLTIPALVLSSILAAVTPRIASMELAGKEQLGLFQSKVYGLMLLLTVPLAIGFWFNGIVLRALFPDFGLASDMLRYFAPSVAIMGVAFAASLLPVQCGKPKIAFYITLVSGVVNVIAAYMGFKAFGVSGLAVATAVVHFLTYGASVVVAHWAFKIPFRVRFS
jgi:O-antigen/teichoic acid export membrane protein